MTYPHTRAFEAVGDEPFTAETLAAAADIGKSTAQVYINDWEKDGRVRWVSQTGGASGELGVYRKTGDEAAPAPARAPDGKPTPQRNLWRTMRMLREFTAVDLVAHSSTEEVPLSSADARSYCQALVRAGYLRCTKKARPPKIEARYRLVRDTGPKPPRERRVKVIYDDNLAEVTHMPGVPS